MSEQPIVFYAGISQLKNLKVVDVTSYGMKYVHAVENEAQDRNFVTKTNINEQLRQHTNVYSMVFRDMILYLSPTSWEPKLFIMCVYVNMSMLVMNVFLHQSVAHTTN